MNKGVILSFLAGVVLTVIVVLLLPFSLNIKGDSFNLEKFYEDLESQNYIEEETSAVRNLDFYWNKIKAAAKWIPDGNIEQEDVIEGKEFYNGSRELQIGALSFHGDAKEQHVMSGKTFYNNSKELKTGSWEFEGNALEDQVIKGTTFYSNSGELKTGILTIPSVIYKGSATAADVLSGETFYSDSGQLKTGLLKIPEITYSGDATVLDVLLGKTFYSDSGELKVGQLVIPEKTYFGDANTEDVMKGKKFYSDSETLKVGTWDFVGTADPGDVITGKTFYAGSKVLLTGTASEPYDYSTQQYCKYDDEVGYRTSDDEDYQGEEAEWTYVNDSIWKDEKSGLYWTDALDINYNIFDMELCGFFASIPRSSYDGSDVECGYAINYCANLDLGGRQDWYLPSQKELLQAYIDGIHNQAGYTQAEASNFTTGFNYYAWSATEAGTGSMYSWAVYLGAGRAVLFNKSTEMMDIRCVARD